MNNSTKSLLAISLLACSLPVQAGLLSEAAKAAAQAASKRSAAVITVQKRTQYAQGAAAKRTKEVMGSIANNAAVNKQRLFVQERVQKAIIIAKNNRPVAGVIGKQRVPTSLLGTFKAHANPGLIYRRDLKGIYIGKTKSIDRYPKRQQEHNLKLRSEYQKEYKTPTYSIVAGAPSGNPKLLQVAEETAMRAQKRFGVKLNNKVVAMNPTKYTNITKK
jgi:hypothetical protein